MDEETCLAITRTAIRLIEDGHKSDKVLGVIKGLYSQWSKSVLAASKGIEMYISLRGAIEHAGGTCPSVDRLCEMSVMELISHLAINKVRFFFDQMAASEEDDASKHQ